MSSGHNGKLIRLDRDNFMGVMQDVIHGFKNDTLTDLILIARVVDKDVDEEDASRIRYSWHSAKGSVYCLGLLEYMKMMIKDWIRDNGYD